MTVPRRDDYASALPMDGVPMTTVWPVDDSNCCSSRSCRRRSSDTKAALAIQRRGFATRLQFEGHLRQATSTAVCAL